MGKFFLGTAVALALALVAFGVMAAANRPRPTAPQLTSMAESAQAMIRAGETMQAHGQAMLDEGRQASNSDLVAHGEHWLRDGQAAVQGGRWMAMDPLAPSSLVTPPAALSQQAGWGALTQTAQAMLHDPVQARSAVDLQALRWNGQAMEAEGRTMAEHGRVMAEQADAMVAQRQLAGATATSLRQAASTLEAVGGQLQGNGQAMVSYAERLQRSLGILR